MTISNTVIQNLVKQATTPSKLAVLASYMARPSLPIPTADRQIHIPMSSLFDLADELSFFDDSNCT